MYLVYKSGFLPKFLGVLLLLDGVAVLWFGQDPAADYPALSYPGQGALSHRRSRTSGLSVAPNQRCG
ncbi:MAG: hypothetical protein R2838_09620 [Caldilineaceae bacterium]